MVIDGGFRLGGTPLVGIKDSTFNTNSVTTGSPASDADILVEGQGSAAVIFAAHMENRWSGDMVKVGGSSFGPYGITELAINAAGSNYTVGDTVSITQSGASGGLATVGSVLGGTVVQLTSIANLGCTPTPSCYLYRAIGTGKNYTVANGVATAKVNCANASCSGLTVNINSVFNGPQATVIGGSGFALGVGNAAVHRASDANSIQVENIANGGSGTSPRPCIQDDVLSFTYTPNQKFPCYYSSEAAFFTGGLSASQLNQISANTWAGVCTIAMLGTTCTITFSTPFNSIPSCRATDQSNVTTVKVTPSATQLTITTTGMSTDTFDYECVGNPN